MRTKSKVVGVVAFVSTVAIAGGAFAQTAPNQAAPVAQNASVQTQAQAVDTPQQVQVVQADQQAPAVQNAVTTPPAAPQYIPQDPNAQQQDAAPPEDQWSYSYAQGRWVYTADRGWIWVPAGVETVDVDEVPYVYLYTPSYGWTWYVSPWGAGPYHWGGWVRHGWYPHGWRGGWVGGSRVVGYLGTHYGHGYYGAHAGHGYYNGHGYAGRGYVAAHPSYGARARFGGRPVVHANGGVRFNGGARGGVRAPAMHVRTSHAVSRGGGHFAGHAGGHAGGGHHR